MLFTFFRVHFGNLNGKITVEKQPEIHDDDDFYRNKLLVKI